MEEGRRWMGSNLVEDTGDSEAQGSEAADALPAADDDAESCSYGSVQDGESAEAREVDDGVGDDECDCGDDVEEWSEEEEDDGLVEQCRRGGGEGVEAVRSGESVACEFVRGVSDKERDKLFWEACLEPEDGDVEI